MPRADSGATSRVVFAYTFSKKYVFAYTFSKKVLGGIGLSEATHDRAVGGILRRWGLWGILRRWGELDYENRRILRTDARPSRRLGRGGG